MKYNSQGANLVGVINGDTSRGADAIIAKSEIKDIASLKGKRIGVAKGTYQEYLDRKSVV